MFIAARKPTVLKVQQKPHSNSGTSFAFTVHIV